MKNLQVIKALDNIGITGYQEVIYNPSYELLYLAETSVLNKSFEKGAHTDTGAIAVKTGIFTGRSPKDRYIVEDDTTKDSIYWDGKVNLPTTNAIYQNKIS
jgi:phosphoenolpyruvate carboxykinase (ATP)